MGGGDGVEKVYGCVPHGMVAVDVEELAAGAVEAVEGRLVGIDVCVFVCPLFLKKINNC